MKRKITFLLAALLLMCGLTWAQTDVLDHDVIGVSGNSYSNWNGLTLTSGAVYAGNTAGGNNAIQMRSSNSNSGIVTTTSAGLVTNITVAWNSNTADGRKLNVYGSDSAYEAASDLYGSNAGTLIGTIEKGTTNFAITDDYAFIGIRSASGALYLDEIQITWVNGGTPNPSITAGNVEIAYNATEGAIEYTINHGVEGGVLTAATEDEWLTTGTVGETVPFTCTVNPDGERVATVTLTYTYNTDQTVTKNVTVTQTTNPNAPGTQNNPYTVAQARAAIDAGVGTQEVYATGIVSAIPTAYNSTYGNITFNMVDEEGDEVFLQAYRCGGDEAANVAVGDVVVVYGNLIKYNTTYEFGQGCEVVSLTHPSVPTINITPATLNVDAQEHLVNYLDLAYENIDVENASSFTVHYYNAEGEEIQLVPGEAWMIAGVTGSEAPYRVLCVIIANEGEARTAYFKVSAVDAENNTVYSNLVTVSQEAYVAPTYAELPFAFNSGRAAIEETEGLSQEGLGSDYGTENTKLKFDGTGDWLLLQFNERPGTLTFDIKGNSFNGSTFTVQTSEDGETFTDLKSYTNDNFGNTVYSEEFTNLDENVRYIKWIYTEKVQNGGNVGLGNIALAEYTEPVPPVPVASITVEFDEIEVTATGEDDYAAITYENLEIAQASDFDIQFYNADGDPLNEQPDWMSAEVTTQIGDEGYFVYYIIDDNEGEARTAYFKVYALNANAELVYSNLVTVNQEAYVAPVLDYATLPFEFDGGRADIETTDGLTQEGLDSDYGSSPKLKFNTTGDWMLLHFNEEPGELAFDIKGNSFSGGTFTVQTSVDGETYEVLATYTELSNTEHETFNTLAADVRYIKWIYTEKVSGNVALGNITLAQPAAPVASITVDPAEVNATVEGGEGTLNVTYANITEILAEVYFCDANGEAATYDWIEAEINEDNNVYYVIGENEGEARTAYLKVYALDDNAEDVYSNLVTVNQAASVVPPTSGEWVMVSLNDLTEDDVFVIVGVYDEDESSFAMPNNGTNAPSAVDVTMVGNTLAGDIAENLKWNLSIGEDGYTFYPNGETESWLYCTSTNNGVRVGTNENNVFTMTPEGYLYNNATSRYIGIYNRQDWRCYTSINNNIKEQTFAFYKRVDGSEIETYTLDITGYGDSDGGYYLISSPVSMIRPTEENGFLTETYDLYRFDQAQEGEEWRNYEAKHFNIASGKGYLYASQENTTLTFTGVPYTGNGEITLTKDDNATFSGWNLVGNPFSQTAYIDRDFYVMNEDGSEIMTDASNGAIEAMQGFFVIAEEDGETLTFSTEAPNQSANLTMNLSQSRGAVIDRAIVRFNECRQLPKFQLNAESTKLYIPQGSKDYAVVRSNAQGEMPVNFKAQNNGIYTISVNAENVEVSYLHLIDNMTGTDIDLLANPSYSFESKTTDYTSRFRLVFNITGVEENTNSTEPFAFFNGSEWVISNIGKATLQMVDLTGRILSSETINGNATINVNESKGIYMLRLVNGESVKVQKIMVK